MALLFTDHAGLDAGEREALRARVADLTTLGQVLDTGLPGAVRPVPDEVIAQDEYTHDVLLAIDQGRYLVFDTT